MPDPDTAPATEPLTFELTETATPEVREAVLAPLQAYNLAQVGPSHLRPLAVLLRDGAGAIRGGLWGRTGWGWLFVELLAVPEAFRGQGLGVALLRQAEEEASRRGCTGAWLDTFSFQAPGFYAKQGYAEVGRIEDYPSGHSRMFLRKTLAAGGKP